MAAARRRCQCATRRRVRACGAHSTGARARAAEGAPASARRPSRCRPSLRLVFVFQPRRAAAARAGGLLMWGRRWGRRPAARGARWGGRWSRTRVTPLAPAPTLCVRHCAAAWRAPRAAVVATLAAVRGSARGISSAGTPLERGGVVRISRPVVVKAGAHAAAAASAANARAHAAKRLNRLLPAHSRFPSQRNGSPIHPVTPGLVFPPSHRGALRACHSTWAVQYRPCSVRSAPVIHTPAPPKRNAPWSAGPSTARTGSSPVLHLDPPVAGTAGGPRSDRTFWCAGTATARPRPALRRGGS